MAHIPNKVQYKRYHCISISDVRSDLKNTSFVKSPADAIVDLCEQYLHDLANVFDRHAPLIFRLTKKDERTWPRDKNPLNRSQLHCQIARCNALVNKDKSDYYSKLISDNSHDSQKLWHELHKTLNRVSDAILPSHKSEKSLTNQFSSFFEQN